jgi:anti-sigma factor RsiW
MDSEEIGAGETRAPGRLGSAITCRELVEFLDDYLSRLLPEPRRIAFDAHLAACPACVAYMKSYQVTLGLEKAAFNSKENPVPAEVPEELVRAVLTACRRG